MQWRRGQGSDELLPGGGGGKAPGEDAQEGVQQAGEETTDICVRVKQLMQMETQALLNLFITLGLRNAGMTGGTSHMGRRCVSWYYIVLHSVCLLSFFLTLLVLPNKQQVSKSHNLSQVQDKVLQPLTFSHKVAS